MPGSLFSTESVGESLPENDHVFLIYSNRSCVTGRNLARYLGCDHGKSCGERYDYMIRWGSSRGVTYIPNERTINMKHAVNRNTDKLRSMQEMEESGVNVPPFSRNPRNVEFPALGRDRQHTQGQDINLILQERDVELTSNDFYVQYIPTHLEYRVHVMDGDVFKVHEKRKRNGEDNHPYIRNAETGWVFVNTRGSEPDPELSARAVSTLGLDFGAVDVVRGEDGEEYVLEVNTAPSLDEANLQRYGERFAEQCGLENYPGMDHPDIEIPEEGEEDE